VPFVAEAETITPASAQENGLFIEVDGQMVPNYDATLVLFEDGYVVSGQVVRIDQDEVLVYLGYKSDGVIPANELDKIFNPLYRIEGDKPVAPRENLGLGLYISERIVAAHGGTIDVESSDEHGTTFTIHLPRHTHTEAGSS
jgi:K+-sensing histidine kinase KdpD